jgi:hypothetical protein
METTDIRTELHRFIDSLGDKKAKAIYTLFEDEIEQHEWQYTDEFKAELDQRYEYYKSGGKMISAEEAKDQIRKILMSGKNG